MILKTFALKKAQGKVVIWSAKRKGTTLDEFEDVRSENGSSQGQLDWHICSKFARPWS